MAHTTDTRSRIASEVRAGLSRAGKSQKALAAYMAVSPTTLTDRMQGRKPFSVEEIMLIAEFLNVDWLTLVPRSSAD